MSNIQNRVERLERGTGMHDEENVLFVKTNVRDGDEEAIPCHEQLARYRANRAKGNKGAVVMIYKHCDICKGSCSEKAGK